MIVINSKNVSKIFLGNKEVTSIWLGDDKIYEKEPDYDYSVDNDVIILRKAPYEVEEGVIRIL